MARLYITLYSVLFITIAFFFLSLTWFPDLVLHGTVKRYYEQAMLGAYELVELRLVEHPPSRWEQEIANLEPHFRYGLGLYSLDQIDLSDKQRRSVQAGELVFREEGEQTQFYKRVFDADRYLMMVLGPNPEQEERDQVEGIVYLIESRFLAHDPAQWPALLQQMDSAFDMPLAMLGLDDPSLPQQRLSDIEMGKTVILGLEEMNETYYKRLGDSQQVFRAGPFPLPPLLRYFNPILYLMLALLVALAVYFWVRPVWRDLNRIDRGVRNFGTGDLDTRLLVRRRSALKPLADAFNTMADRLQRLIHSHRELTGAVSHELRTPIARLRFRLDMLEEPQHEGDRERHISAMRKDIRELEELVSESLSYSRLDRERPELVLEPVSLNGWLNELSIDLEESLPTQRAVCERSADTVDRVVNLDSRLMGRAVKNLLRNAHRHATSKIVLRGDSGNGEARIVVEDDGSGVPEQERERIFEPFARLDSARDRESGGVGLGLAIVNQIARWHGGRVWVETSSLGGARFIIAWPEQGFGNVKQ
ncbi:MAG: ATP-binding protein [Candidatus Thiodiazotropha endolucinida]